MSNRVSAVHRKPSSHLSNRSAPNKKKAKPGPSKKTVSVKARKPPPKKVASRAGKKVARPKVKIAKGKRAAPSRKKASVAKKAVIRAAKPAKEAKRDGPRPIRREVVTKQARVKKGIEAAKKASSKVVQEPSSPSNAGPPTPRSIAPPVVPEQNQQPKLRVKSPGKVIVRAAYVSPAQRVLEAQQAAQMRSQKDSAAQG